MNGLAAQTEAEFLKSYEGTKFQRPNTTVDVVIYTIKDDALHVLIIKRNNHPFKNYWSLVGGFVDIHQDVDLEDTALRKLKEKTGVASPYLEQFGTIGNANRDPRGWSISTVYFALLPLSSIKFISDPGMEELKWSKINNGKISEKLAFDHQKILSLCTQRLQNKVLYTSLPFYLLEKKFTLTELRRIYEIILETTLEPKSFRRRMLHTKLIEETGETVQSNSKKPAMLYKSSKHKKPFIFNRIFEGNL